MKPNNETLHPNLQKTRQLEIIANGTREQVIAWLDWNDANGCYTDEDCRNEGLPVLNLITTVNIMVDQLTVSNPCFDYLTTEYSRFMPEYGCAYETLAGDMELTRAKIDYLKAYVNRWENAERIIESDNQESVFDAIVYGTPALVFDVCQHIGIPCLDKHGDVVESIEQADSLTIEDINREYVIKHICDNMLADTVRKWLDI